MEMNEHQTQHSRTLNSRLADLEQAHSSAIAMKDTELRQSAAEIKGLRDDLLQDRTRLEVERVNNETLKSDLNMAQTHVEQLQQENLALNEDVERLQKIAAGLEGLNKQFQDLENRQEAEKQQIKTEKQREIGEIAGIIDEKQEEIQKMADLIQGFNGQQELKDQEISELQRQIQFLKIESKENLERFEKERDQRHAVEQENSKKDAKYDKLKTMSEQLLEEQRVEFEVCLNKMQFQVDKMSKVQK